MSNKESAQFKARDEKYQLSAGYARRQKEIAAKKSKKDKKEEDK